MVGRLTRNLSSSYSESWPFSTDTLPKVCFQRNKWNFHPWKLASYWTFKPASGNNKSLEKRYNQHNGLHMSAWCVVSQTIHLLICLTGIDAKHLIYLCETFNGHSAICLCLLWTSAAVSVNSNGIFNNCGNLWDGSNDLIHKSHRNTTKLLNSASL